MPPADPDTGEPAAHWSRINNGVKELIDQILVSHALHDTRAVATDGIPSVTANPTSLAGMTAPSDHRPLTARFTH